PVVIFLRPGSFPAELRLGGDRDDYLIFRFIPCDLGRIPAMIHLDSRNIVARLNLPNMAYPEDQRIEVYAKAQEGLVALEKDMDKRKKYVDFIDMYADLSNDEIVRYQAEWLSSSRVKEEMMGLRKTFMQEGREEGRREGLMKAIEIGLTLKFGKNSLGILKTISQTADVNQLDALSDKILTVKDISELRQYIKTLSSEHSWTH
ncbi:MAG: hypothetical protein ACLFQY_20435, partial [Desulfococcaceae bacterium]